ncbi:hypothetical protein Rs2_21373 [Raphanus sativus]|nr:hypothetical protein Rs2_21373 [Raphanus sativus]
MLSEHHKEVLQCMNASFRSPLLTSLMMLKDRQFQAAVRKERLRWDPRLTQLILLLGKTWMKEVHTVYTPMILEDMHWVRLAVNLGVGDVELMDSQPSLYDDGEVLGFIKPILQMLPYLLRYVAKYTSHDLSPFTWSASLAPTKTSGQANAARSM